MHTAAHKFQHFSWLSTVRRRDRDVFWVARALTVHGVYRLHALGATNLARMDQASKAGAYPRAQHPRLLPAQLREVLGLRRGLIRSSRA